MLQEDDRNAFGVLAGRPLLAPGDSHFPLSITCLVPKEDVLLPPRPRGHRYPTEHTLAELGVDAAEALFVDDTAVNVEAAVALGMHGVVVDADPSSALARIRELTGLS